MKNLSATAERLQTIQSAQEHFLGMFALECIWDQPRAYERLAKDLRSFDGTSDADLAYVSRRVE